MRNDVVFLSVHLSRVVSMQSRVVRFPTTCTPSMADQNNIMSGLRSGGHHAAHTESFSGLLPRPQHMPLPMDASHATAGYAGLKAGPAATVPTTHAVPTTTSGRGGRGGRSAGRGRGSSYASVQDELSHSMKQQQQQQQQQLQQQLQQQQAAAASIAAGAMPSTGKYSLHRRATCHRCANGA